MFYTPYRKELHKDILETFNVDKIKLDEAFADRRTYSVMQSAVTSLGDVFASLESSKETNACVHSADNSLPAINRPCLTCLE